MQMPRKNTHGFTLIELLIVVAIIGILAAIAIPQFTQYRAGAVESKVEGNLSNCMTMLAAKYADNATEEHDCAVGGGQNATLKMVDGGAIEFDDNGDFTDIDGYDVNCTLDSQGSSTTVSCEAE